MRRYKEGGGGKGDCGVCLYMCLPFSGASITSHSVDTTSGYIYMYVCMYVYVCEALIGYISIYVFTFQRCLHNITQRGHYFGILGQLTTHAIV